MTLLKVTLEHMAAERAANQIFAQAQKPQGSVVEDVVHIVGIASLEALADDYDQAQFDAHRLTHELQDLTGELARQNATGGLSMESLAFAQIALRHYSGTTGVTVEEMVPSLESFSPTEKVKIDLRELQCLQVSVEGYFTEMGRGILSEFQRAYGLAWARVLRHRSRHAQLATKAAEAGNGAVSEEYITDGMKQLHQRGAAPKDMGAYLREFLKIMAVMTTRFADDAEKATEANYNFLHGRRSFNRQIGLSEFDATTTALLSRWRDPRLKLPANYFHFEAPGGRMLFEDKPHGYRGKDPVTKAFYDLAYTGVPTKLVSTPGPEWNGDGCKALSNAEIVGLSSDFLAVLNKVSAPGAFWDSLKSNAGMLTPILIGGAMIVWTQHSPAPDPLQDAAMVATAVSGAVATSQRSDTLTVQGPDKGGNAAMKARAAGVQAALNTVYDFRLRTRIDSVTNLLRVSSAFLDFGTASVKANRRVKPE